MSIWLFLLLLDFVINLLLAIHLILGSHPTSPVQHFPTRTSKCSTFRLGKFCAAICTLWLTER